LSGLTFPALTAARPYGRHLAHSEIPMNLPAGVVTPSTEPPDATLGAGFVLYVGLEARHGSRHNAALVELAETLRELAQEALPVAETYTTLSLTTRLDGDDDVSAIRNELADDDAEPLTCTFSAFTTRSSRSGSPS